MGGFADAGGRDRRLRRRVEDTRACALSYDKVNGVRIAARGGNWGMDDSRKRVSREKLEPISGCIAMRM